MNVLELINLLEQMDETLPVIVEGCDCYRQPIGVEEVDGRVEINTESWTSLR